MQQHTFHKTVSREQLTDEELVRLFIQTQHNKYFEALYERYADKVYRKCLSFFKDLPKAQDLTHDIFIKLILRLGSFKGDSKFSTWLYSIVYNHCMDELHSKKRKSETSLEKIMEIADDTDLNNLFENGDIESHNLKIALDKLNTEEKAMLLMKYSDDMGIRDIAGIFKTTESAVKMRLLRSREKLRKKYLETMLFLAISSIKLFELTRIFLGY